MIAYFGVLDLWLTHRHIGGSGFGEGNPLARHLVAHTGSVWSLTPLKVASLLVGGGMLVGLRRHRVAEFAAWAFVTVSVLLMLVWVLYLEGVEYSLAFGPLNPSWSVERGPSGPQ
ncbi:MAG: DUF5658 family protein [Planctomycetota bacterium]